MMHSKGGGRGTMCGRGEEDKNGGEGGIEG